MRKLDERNFKKFYIVISNILIIYFNIKYYNMNKNTKDITLS